MSEADIGGEVKANAKNRNCDILNFHGVAIESDFDEDYSDDNEEKEADEDYVEVYS